jgi:hypothetical protein
MGLKLLSLTWHKIGAFIVKFKNYKRMKCIISKSIELGINKGKSLKIISRYLKMKYRISISESLLSKKLELMREKKITLKRQEYLLVN